MGDSGENRDEGLGVELIKTHDVFMKFSKIKKCILKVLAVLKNSQRSSRVLGLRAYSSTKYYFMLGIFKYGILPFYTELSGCLCFQL